MDFGSVLYTAHKNEKSANKEVKCYKTKFDPPKKETKPTKPNLSANIQKYLQKREEEERRKAEEEKRKKEELLALRSQDKKAFKRVQTMLKRTKSANKSVMEDAIDDVNTVVTMAGPQQCDEDDYGYVSKEASDFYAKMMDKYANMPPEEPKFSQSKKVVPKDLNAAKDRVRAALQRAEEEEMMPHKRKRKSKSDRNDEDNGNENNDERRKSSREPSPVVDEPKPKKPKKIAPPPMDFSSLLKLAEQKQFEPITIEKKVEDEERPMTKRQKLEYEREMESRRRKEEREAMRIAALSRNSKSSDSGDRRDKPNGLGRIPKKSQSSDFRPKEEEMRKNSGNSDDDKVKRTTHSNSSSYEQKRDSSILKSTLLKSDNRKPLKPTQPSISSNKIKSRNHNVSDEEQSDESDAGYERSHHYQRDKTREHKRELSSSLKEVGHKSSSELERSYSERNGYKKSSNMDNECTDSQSSNDSRKYQPSKSQSSSNSNHHKYKPQVKYKPDSDRYEPEKYKPSYIEKPISKKPYSTNGKERSYSSDNSNRYSQSNGQSCSESEDENRYKPSKIASLSHKNLYKSKTSESDGQRAQSPDYSNHNKKRKDSYSESESEKKSRNEPPRKKPSLNKVKKISSLFEGSDDDQPTYHDNVHRHRESEDKKPKSAIESNKPRMSTESKFKIPKGSKSESEKSNLSESAKPSTSSISKSSGQLTFKHHLENSKSERASSNSKLDTDRSRISSDKIKPRTSTDSPKIDSKENMKKPEPLKAEEALKKSASVWSKPCNTSSTNAAPRPPGGLSESQLQRLREMNKKPTPTKPPPKPEDRFRSGQSEIRSSSNGRPSPRDERKSDGRPIKPGTNSVQGKQSLLMKAAADRGAVIRAQMASSRSSDSSSRLPEHKSLSKSSTSSPANSSRGPPTKDSRPKAGEMKPKQFPPSDLKPKQFPPSDLRPKQFPPKDIRPRQFPPSDVKRKPKPRRIEDSEDEYDSDMDSFIDDSTDLRPEDISREIQQIFGYDKSRYATVDDDDDECMESNFGQIDREEYRSLQIGAKEDYEELMRDLERKKRAKQRKMMEKGRR